MSVDPLEPMSPYDKIDDLQTQLSGLQDKVIALEADLDLLKNLINQMCTADQISDEPIEPWEIRNTLQTWATEA